MFSPNLLKLEQTWSWGWQKSGMGGQVLGYLGGCGCPWLVNPFLRRREGTTKFASACRGISLAEPPFWVSYPHLQQAPHAVNNLNKPVEVAFGAHSQMRIPHNFVYPPFGPPFGLTLKQPQHEQPSILEHALPGKACSLFLHLKSYLCTNGHTKLNLRVSLDYAAGFPVVICGEILIQRVTQK